MLVKLEMDDLEGACGIDIDLPNHMPLFSNEIQKLLFPVGTSTLTIK